MSNDKKTCILVCAGEMHSEDRAKIEKYVLEGSYLIAVDGGADYCREIGLGADLYLGDFDSVSETELKNLSGNVHTEILTLPREKDDTDTLAALKVGMEKGYKEFYIFGGLGGRLDHTIANIQCLLFLRRNGYKGYMFKGDEKLFVLKNETVSFGAEEKGIFSLFSLNGSANGVDISGMKYNLENGVITNDFPIGVSNEFIGERATVTVREGELLVVVNEG